LSFAITLERSEKCNKNRVRNSAAQITAGSSVPALVSSTDLAMLNGQIRRLDIGATCAGLPETCLSLLSETPFQIRAKLQK
jgi:hypothetical protein